jgi:copper(I)-binding protein
MKKKILLLLALTLLSTAALADHVRVTGAWIREAPPMARVMAAYMTVYNRSKSPVWITHVSSPAFGAAEMHRTVVRNGMGRMIRQRWFRIPARGTLVLKPRSYHIMLFRPVKALKAGDKVPIKLTLGSGKSFTIIFTVRKAK